MKFQFKGWAAVPVVILFVLFLGYRATSARDAMDGAQGDRLRLHLQGVYTSANLPGLREAYAAGNEDAVSKKLIALEDIQFTDVRVKGLGDEVIVKVTIEVAGDVPPDGISTRYYRLRHRTIGGWEVLREVAALSYYLKLF